MSSLRSTTHPAWCAQAHHCTAERLPNGEHASVPEVWTTDVGRTVATRYQHHDGHSWIELRTVLPLDPREPVAQAQCRHLIAAAHLVLRRAFRIEQKGHLR